MRVRCMGVAWVGARRGGGGGYMYGGAWRGACGWEMGMMWDMGWVEVENEDAEYGTWRCGMREYRAECGRM